jgi:hypothetical protein
MLHGNDMPLADHFFKYHRDGASYARHRTPLKLYRVISFI